MNENERLSQKIIQLLEAPKGIFAVIKKDSGYYEVYSILLCALYADGNFGKIILKDNEFCEVNTRDDYVGCYTEKKLRESFPESFLIFS